MTGRFGYGYVWAYDEETSRFRVVFGSRVYRSDVVFEGYSEERSL